MQFIDVVDVDENFRARRTIALVLAKVKHYRIARNLYIPRAVSSRSALPVDLEAKPIHVERLRK